MIYCEKMLVSYLHQFFLQILVSIVSSVNRILFISRFLYFKFLVLFKHTTVKCQLKKDRLSSDKVKTQSIHINWFSSEKKNQGFHITYSDH